MGLISRARQRVARWVAPTGPQSQRYAGAEAGRRGAGINSNNTSANSEIEGSEPALTDRARMLIRDNPYAARAVRVWADNEVGKGITPVIKSARLRAAFSDWAAECDADGQHDIYGIQWLASAALFGDGEALIRRRRRRPSDKLSLPMQMQVLESDWIDRDLTAQLNNNAGWITQGIQYNQIGRRTGAWLFDEHPGNMGIFSRTTAHSSKFVPIEDLILAYEMGRPGQSRGVTRFAPVMMTAAKLGHYLEMELDRARLQSSQLGVITRPSGREGLYPGGGLNEGSSASDDPAELDHGGPRVDVLFDGEEWDQSNPQLSPNFDPFVTTHLHAFAVGLGIPYAMLTGDLRAVNFSSSRIGHINFQSSIETHQKHVMVRQVCDRMWDWFAEAEAGTSQLRLTEPRVKWLPRPMKQADEFKQHQADKAAVRNGTKSLQDHLAEQGHGDWKAHLKEIAKGNATVDALGLILDTDPRYVTGSGQLQQGAQEDAEPEPAASTEEE